MTDGKQNGAWGPYVGIGAIIFSLIWWTAVSHLIWWRLVLQVGLSLAAFTMGCTVAFLFTSYGEETGTIGKVRDWLIGGITGLTVAKAGSIKNLLVTFTAAPGPNEYALAFATAVFYVGLGFFFMFFQRELILNVLLAQSRAERGKLEGTRQAGLVIKNFLVKLPASILSGVDDVDDIIGVGKQEADALQKSLYSDDVKAFLTQAEDASAQGTPLDWDVVSKLAYIHYYRAYFEKDDKPGQVKRGIDWISRALVMNPHHADLTMKLAAMLAMSGDYRAAVEILERLITSPDAPMLARQWLGFYLLFIPGRLGDSIKYSKQYYEQMHDNDCLFNIAAAYGQAYCRPSAETQLGTSRDENRALALDYLKQALTGNPAYVTTVKEKWTTKGESFDCLATDQALLDLIGSFDPGTVPAVPAATR